MYKVKEKSPIQNRKSRSGEETHYFSDTKTKVKNKDPTVANTPLKKEIHVRRKNNNEKKKIHQSGNKIRAFSNESKCRYSNISIHVEITNFNIYIDNSTELQLDSQKKRSLCKKSVASLAKQILGKCKGKSKIEVKLTENKKENEEKMKEI